MSAPKLEDLPKVAVDLKSQLEGFSTENLKDTVTQEKIVLPTAEGTCNKKIAREIFDLLMNEIFILIFRCGHRKIATKPHPRH